MAGFPDSGSVPVRKYTPDAADSSRATTPSNSLRGPATALPVQFDSSAVRSLLGSPWTRKILIVAVGMRGSRKQNPGTQYRFLQCLLAGGAGLAGLGIKNMSPEATRPV